MQNDGKSGKHLQTTSFTIAPNIIVFLEESNRNFCQLQISHRQAQKTQEQICIVLTVTLPFWILLARQRPTKSRARSKKNQPNRQRIKNQILEGTDLTKSSAMLGNKPQADAGDFPWFPFSHLIIRPVAP